MNKTAAISCLAILVIFFSFGTGLVGGYIGTRLTLNNGDLSQTIGDITNSVEVINEESAVIDVAENSKDSVVSIVITKDVPLYENSYDPYDFFNLRREQVGSEERQVGAGTGFIISEDGLVITNRHVVEDEDASYTVIFSDGTKKEAKVLSKDTVLDIAFVKLEGSGYKALNLGSSESLKVGQSVIAIGNALGEFSNTVSTGIISGLQRDIVATDSRGLSAEELNGVIQTDASINQGNSGGPLLDIKGNVIGVNVAVAGGEAENIGFAIPVDLVKDLMQRLNTDGTIERPVLGVRYLLIDEEIKEQNNLSVDYGALIVRGDTTADLAVIPGSPADKAGLRENDIILEIDGKQITTENTLQFVIQNYKINDTVTLKILRQGNQTDVSVKLEKFQ
jgi:serine protease Do